MDLGIRAGGGHGKRDRPGTRAEVDHNGLLDLGDGRQTPCQQAFRGKQRYEHVLGDRDHDATQPGVPEDVADRDPVGSPGHESAHIARLLLGHPAPELVWAQNVGQELVGVLPYSSTVTGRP
jgi:hypothetical protein